MQKADSNSSAGTKADSEQKVEDTSVSQHSRKHDVVGSQSPSDTLKIECLKAATHFAGNFGAIESHYKILIGLVNFS